MSEHRPFSSSYRAYDLVYASKDTAGEVDYIASLVNRYLPNARRVIEFGCGTGRHMKGLRGKGYETVGIDSSIEMLEVARKEKNGEVFLGDIRDAHLDQVFDVGLSIFHVMSYLIQDQDLEKAIKNVGEMIRDGGLLIFDFWYKPCVLKHGAKKKSLRAEDSDLVVTRKTSPTDHGGGRIDVLFEYKLTWLNSGKSEEFEEVHKMRSYDLSEIEEAATRSGFRLEHSEQWLTAEDVSEDKWGVVVVLRKVES